MQARLATQTPAVGALRTSAAERKEPEIASDDGRGRDAPRPVLRASESLRWRGAVESLPERARIADATPGENGPGEGGGDTGGTAPIGTPKQSDVQVIKA